MMSFLKILKRLKKKLIRESSVRLTPDEVEIKTKIRNKKITYLSDVKLNCIIHTINSIKEKNITGVFIEAGCALGGSTALIARMKPKNTPLYVYDVFGLIPAPTEEDTEDTHKRYKTIISGKSEGIGGNQYYGYQENLYETVLSNLKDLDLDCEQDRIVLIKGLLQETMKIKDIVAFAHIDVDWYEPVKFCLENICPKLVIGGSIIFDNYHDWGGCRKAVDEYLRTVIGQFDLDDTAGSMKITRMKGEL